MVNIIVFLCFIVLSKNSETANAEKIQLIESSQEKGFSFLPKPSPLFRSGSLDDRQLSSNKERFDIDETKDFFSFISSPRKWSIYDQENSYKQTL